jgi:hypothetical protein
MKPILAIAGVTARTWLAFVAGACDVVKVRTACSLQEIATDRSGVAKLRGCSRQKRLGDSRKASGEGAIMGKVRVADQCSNPHAAVGKVFNPVEIRKVADVYKSARADNVALHQIHQVGASGQINGAWFRSGSDSFLNRCWSHIVEGPHATSLRLAASRAL